MGKHRQVQEGELGSEWMRKSKSYKGVLEIYGGTNCRLTGQEIRGKPETEDSRKKK